MRSSGMRESEQHCVKSRRIWLAQAGSQDEEQLAWQVRRRWWHHAVTAGLLIFLGITARNEALEAARELGGAFQSVGLVGIGIVSTLLLLDAITRRR
jgi:hypothetical protein